MIVRVLSWILTSVSLAALAQVSFKIGRRPVRQPLGVAIKTGDLGILQLFGCCASFSSSIVLALYVQDQVAAQHTASILLWGIVPSRTWPSFQFW
jgi:hypothetical protein